MKILSMCGLLFFVFIQWVEGQVRDDSLGVDMIYLEKSEEKNSNVPPSVEYSRDFLRNMFLVRIDLNDPFNSPLMNVENEKGNSDLFMAHLIRGLQEKKIEAWHPLDIRQPYDYLDLLFDLMELEGISAGSLGEEVDKEDLGLQWVLGQFDLLTDKGFSIQNSRKFRRIRYLRMIWYNPNSARGAHIVGLIPFSSLEPFLDQLQCRSSAVNSQMISLKEFFHLQLFRGKSIPLENDLMQKTPMNPEERRLFKRRNSELWSN